MWDCLQVGEEDYYVVVEVFLYCEQYDGWYCLVGIIQLVDWIDVQMVQVVVYQVIVGMEQVVLDYCYCYQCGYYWCEQCCVEQCFEVCGWCVEQYCCVQ